MTRQKQTITPPHRFDKMMMTCASGHEANPVDYSKNSLTMLTTTPLIAQGFRPQVNVKLNDHNPYSNCSGRSSNGSNVRSAHIMKNHTSGSNYSTFFSIHRIRTKTTMEVFEIYRSLSRALRTHLLTMSSLPQMLLCAMAMAWSNTLIRLLLRAVRMTGHHLMRMTISNLRPVHKRKFHRTRVVYRRSIYRNWKRA